MRTGTYPLMFISKVYNNQVILKNTKAFPYIQLYLSLHPEELRSTEVGELHRLNT